MKEIEKKILEIDKKKVSMDLEKMGAAKNFEGVLKVKYLDTEDEKIRKSGDLLRVREFGDEYTEIVYKTNKRIENECKVYDEYTFKGKSFEDALKFFKKLNLKTTCSYEKKRTVYYYQDSEIVIDEYPGIPPLLEIESANPEQIENIIKYLGLNQAESSCETINELLARKYKNVKLNNLKF
jgi:adenylate cyclase class 2